MINSLDLTIWGRDFTLPVDYDCFDDEQPYKEQNESLEKFMSNLQWLTESKSALEEFCRERVLEDEANEKKDNVFSYIKPDYIFVKREKKKTRVALMCKYRYDQEHGLAIVFACDGMVLIGSQDIIL